MEIIIVLLCIFVFGVDVFRGIKKAQVAHLDKNNVRAFILMYSVGLAGALTAFAGIVVQKIETYYIAIGIVVAWISLSSAISLLLDTQKPRE